MTLYKMWTQLIKDARMKLKAISRLKAGDRVKDLLNKDNICSFLMGVALIVCIATDYSTEVACAIGGALGGAIKDGMKKDKVSDKEESKCQM